MLTFKLQIERYDCDIIQEAVQRYYHLIFINANSNQQTNSEKFNNENAKKYADTFLGYLDVLHIHLMTPCENFPSAYMDERCRYCITRITQDEEKMPGFLFDVLSFQLKMQPDLINNNMNTITHAFEK